MPQRILIATLLPLFAAGAASCQQPRPADPAAAPGSACTLVDGPRRLPGVLLETSGLARSTRDPALFWTHNDGRDPVLHALDVSGTVLGQSRIAGLSLVDWEDIESARCAGGPCLLVADIGDNRGRRAEIAIHEVPEPEPGAEAHVARTLRLRYPDGAQDAEALFALPDGSRFLVTKGRHRAITLYRVPATAGADEAAVLEPVRALAPRPRQSRDRVTGATASPSGRWVALRTYRTLLVFSAEGLLADAPPAAEFDLTIAREEQGEGVVLDDQGGVWLTSESESGTPGPTWARLSCPLPVTS